MIAIEKPQLPKLPNWDLSGTISDCIKRYAHCLSEEEFNIILQGLEEGLTDQQIKQLFRLHNPEKMERYRKIYAIRNIGILLFHVDN